MSTMGGPPDPFQIVYVSVAGAALVLLVGEIVAPYVHSRGRKNERWATLDRTQVFLTLLQLGVSATAIIQLTDARALLAYGSRFVAAESAWAVLWLATLFVTAKTKQTPVSGHALLPLFAASIVARLVHVRAIAFAEPTTQVPLSGALLSLLLTAVQLVVETVQRYWQATFVGSLLSQTEQEKGIREPCREQSASLLSWMTYSWIDALLIKARSKPLEDEDIWDLAERDKTMHVIERFKPFQRRSSSLMYGLFSFFKWRICVVFVGCVIGAVLDFSKTYFLNRIIVFLQSPRDAQDEYYGYLLLVGLLFGQLITSTVNGWVFYLARRNAINLRSTLVSEIYEKALRRSAGIAKEKKGEEGKKAKSMFDKPDQKANIGKIVSLMSSDANRLYNFAGFIHRPLVDLPISAVISVTALLYLLGPSALAGLLVVMISGPATGLISKWMIKEQLAYSSATDNRTQVINEALQGIRIIKYFGWEEEFVKRIGKSRENELSKAMKLWIYWIGYIVIAWGGSILVVFSSFFCYTVIAGHTLDPATAFTSVTLLHQVGVSLNVLPMIGMQLMRAKVSLDRIADFLKEEELEKYGGESSLNSSNSNYNNAASRGTDPVTEQTPLLAGEAVGINVEDVESEPPIDLPSGYETPAIGFYRGKFMYFGTDDKKKVTGSAVGSAAGTPQPTRRKAWFPWFGRKGAPGNGDSSAQAVTVDEREQGAFELRDVTVTFPLHRLSVVVGSTGSGKSSLLLSLLGELKRVRGFGFLPDPRMNPGAMVAYVAQTAFLLNATIRDNILFGNAYDEARYNAVIEACALVRDLEILEGGDLTEIGEKGINMSGGQKQRISLARAAYSQASIILFDDCLSAVDAPTARHLLFKCILGPLMQNKTKILVTHATGLVLPHADYIVAMKNGEIVGCGTLSEVKNIPELEISISKQNLDNEIEELALDRAEAAKAMVGERAELKGVSKKGTKIVDDEDKSTGSVKLSVYVSYFRAGGGFLFFSVFLLAFVGSTGVSFLSDLWIKIWTDASKPSDLTLPVPLYNEILWLLSIGYHNPHADRVEVGIAPFVAASLPESTPTSGFEYTRPDHSATYYISVYAGLSLLGLLVSVLTRLWVLYGGLMASRALHVKLANAIFGAPMRFFEKTPVGRLLNRFTKDIATIDNECMDSLDSFFRLIIQMGTTIVLILYVAPASGLIIPVVALCYYWISSLYLEASRELKRLESISNSPIYAQFSETLIGVSTVRAYGTEKRFSCKMEDKVDANNRNSFYLWTANRWLNLRCEYLSAVMTSVVGAAIIIAGLDPGWAGLTMIYVFEFTSNLTWLIRCHANMDMAMNAVERVDEYAAIEQEPAAIIPGNRPPQNWPSRGKIDVRNLSLRYQDDTPNVLHAISFSINASEKIGIVGRTGAGKSTLTLAFFRILNNFEGSIIIDGVDISKIGLRDLRSRLTIIPQDPVLFEGTLRFNLDPLGAYNDETIWDAVKAVGLLESMQTGSVSRTPSSANLLSEGSSSTVVPSVNSVAKPEVPVLVTSSGGLNLTLEYDVAESGSNFSQGQRQLICMARAILRQTKVFFLDEATASVDESTDANIQKTIRTSFKEATVVTIAHGVFIHVPQRLRTIIDYDRVLVLERGRIEEFDTPSNLLKVQGGIFKKMCEESGEFDELVKLATAALEK
ncbi:ABC transporter type 1, transmembrane domain-containing protein [Chytriomyces sp. MP71]|nr:ABC transporter type 1, transmembrane domain-containing protein [Chytriomyces sp. MP71]